MLALIASWLSRARTEWLLCAVLAGGFGGSARLPAADTTARPLGFYDVWQADEGWQQNTVIALLQSREGYLWLGTYHGLVRFDGVRFVVFDSGNTPGLQNGLITSLYEDPQGVLWIGHETGQLTRYAQSQFEPVALGPKWPGGTVEAISSDEAGDVWLLNDTGVLLRVRDGHSVTLPGGVSPSRKATLARARDGTLWLCSGGIVARLERGQIQPVQFPETTADDFFEKVFSARDGGLWVVGNERLRKWREGRWAEEFAVMPRTPGAITLVLEMRSGALLLGTMREGLYLLAPGTAPQHFSRTNGLSHNWVRALCEDHEGNLWIGTGAGLDSLRPRKVKMLSAPDAWQGCAVLSFSARPDGSAWIGTEGAGLYHYDQGRWTAFTEAQGMSNLFVWSVLETRQGELFAGTFGGGLLVKREGRFLSEGPLSQITAPVVALYQGCQDELWIGTTIGLLRYAAGRLTWAAGKDKLAFPDIRAITEGPDGTLWLGMSGGGLGALRDGVLTQYRKHDGLRSDFVISLYAEPDGTLWIGTSDNGLIRFKAGRFAVIGLDQGLPSNIIGHILDDGAGHLWMGSYHGILRASKTDLNRCADGDTPAVVCLSYGKAEGLLSPTCSGGFQPGACRTADGRLWFPTAKGLAIIDPATVRTNPVPPPVKLEEVLVDGQILAERTWRKTEDKSAAAEPQGFASAMLQSAAALRIPPGHQRFEFRYTGLSFMAPDKVRFRYKLEGLEPEWVEAGTKRVVQYSYLPPGSYTFRVMACNNDGIWNEAGASLAFTVLPYFWQTWWFKTACLASGAGAVGAGVFWISRRRVRRRLEQLERQRALERERARIARDIHDDLGASLTRITLLSQSVRSDIDGQTQTAADVDQIYSTARELTRAMDEIVWAVNPKHDTLDSLVTYLGRFAQHFLSAAGLRCRLDVPLNLPSSPLTSEIRHNVFLAFKEALNNAVKHAHATEVRISLELLAGGFSLMIADNGHGFDWPTLPTRSQPPADGARLAGGNGLQNMQRRLEEIGGRCEWTTAPGEGTRVKLAVVSHR